MVGAALLSFVLYRTQGANLVSTSGQAEQTLKADVVNVSVTARTFDADSGTASKFTTTATAKARAALLSALPGAKIFPTQDAEPRPEYEPSGGSGLGGGGFGGGQEASVPKIKGYSAESGFRVEGLDDVQIDRLTKAVSGIDGTAANIDSYGVKDPAAARKAVLRAAFLDAREKAEESASAAGCRLGAVALLESEGASLTPWFEPSQSPPGMVLGRRPVKKVVARASVKVRFYLISNLD